MPLLGAELHHFGSTAVPGLAAKPVIDMTALVSDLDAPIEALMNGAGWQFLQAFNATLAQRRFLCYPSASHRQRAEALCDRSGLRNTSASKPRHQGWFPSDLRGSASRPIFGTFAADAFGQRCRPIVCTNGQPRATTMVLLRSLANASIHLCHHGDFDWGGLSIGDLLHRRLPSSHGAFDRDAYLRRGRTSPYRAVDRGTRRGMLGPIAS
jgi:uncharacterized protein DUF2399/GrpB protein